MSETPTPPRAPTPGEAELRAALRRAIVLDVSPGDFLPSDDPDWEMLNAAISELVVLRAVAVAALAVVDAFDWDGPTTAENRALREAVGRLELLTVGLYDD